MEKILNLLQENGFKCNADGREFIFNQVGALASRELDSEKWMPVLKYAEEVGGCHPGETYDYVNAQGFISTAKVTGLYNLPQNMVNPVVVCFSGMMTAHICTFEVLRMYAKQTGKVLPLLAIGKGGNKGLYESVFNRENGLMVGSEYNAYYNLLEQLAPKEYVRANERICRDMDTSGNFDELYMFAKESGMSEVTFILVSGNFSYDKRLLAEFMLKARDSKYADVRINFILAHCPLITNLSVVDGHISEIMLGYVAASLGPLMKDTIGFDGSTTSEHPERYLMPGVATADWSKFEELICKFSNMGWPYAELLYGISHEQAVLDIILSDLHARGSFSPESYDLELMEDLKKYQEFLGGKYQGGSFLEYLNNTPNEGFIYWGKKVKSFQEAEDALRTRFGSPEAFKRAQKMNFEEICNEIPGLKEFGISTWVEIHWELEKKFGK